jgi:neutral amino acid transport system permease protein
VATRVRVALLVVAGLVLLAPAMPAVGAVPDRAGGAPDLVLAQTAESVRGTLVDPDDEPIAGVTIAVESADGSFADATTSSDDGSWEIPLPASGAYVVTLDADTLPPGVGLRDPDRATLEVDIRGGQQRTLLFPTGEATVGTAVSQRVLGRMAAGIQFGLIIAITAIGLSLIYGTTGLVNFSHGELVTLGAVVAWFLNAPAGTGLGVPLIAAGLIATLVTAAVGGGIEARSVAATSASAHRSDPDAGDLDRPDARAAKRHPAVVRRTQPPLLRLHDPADDVDRAAADHAPRPGGDGARRADPGRCGDHAAAHRIGKAMRAVSDNRDLAESSGIDVQRVILIIWVLGGAGLAGFGGVLAATVENVSFLLGFRLLLLMFAGIILGGLGHRLWRHGRLDRRRAGHRAVHAVVLPELKFVWALLVLILILLVRPQGILGQRERIG